MLTTKKTAILFIFLLSFFSKEAQSQTQRWKDIVYQKDDQWFKTSEAIGIADNVLLYQRDIGGWPKNIQMQQPLSDTEKAILRNLKSDPNDCTIDNGATVLEMVFLSRMYRQVPDERYKEAFLAGLNYLLEAQYDNGGWPQFYPLQKGYYSHITYNDKAMVNVLQLLKEIKNDTGYFSISPSQEMKQRASLAFNKGIDCILKTQYIQNGILTGWCAQYDEVTLLPAKARSYELPSLSGQESAEIVELLMSLKKPSDEIITSVNRAVAWFERTKITNLKEVKVYDEAGKAIDRKMAVSADAKPLWARFMELDNNKPFFCDRDGIKKDSLSQIGYERRNGYAWYSSGPQEILDKYAVWREENTKKDLTDKDTITVAQDGSGDFISIQDAINSCKSFPYNRITVFIKNGIYKEKIKVHEWNSNLQLIGESKENTIITFNDYFNKVGLGRNSTFFTYTMLVEANDVVLKNLTIENSSGEVGQAVALSVTSTHIMVLDCRLLGNQDTLYATGIGKQYYKNCYIEGTTDFIFGSATAYFDNCEIYSKSDSYITAASTPKNTEFGFVFNNCKLTADSKVTKVYLGRPWRIYAKTVFINCELGSHILPEGWHNWSKPEAEKNSFYAEYKNTGKGANTQGRVKWSHQLSKKHIKRYTIKNILGDTIPNLKTQWYEAI